ncbi:MAG: ABC transporter substrate-binding protein [Herpetosiphonaceae bacterium]|nr:ABC transporter substrate-binding protein [Herpetosiphonaceae bacterium]
MAKHVNHDTERSSMVSMATPCLHRVGRRLVSTLGVSLALLALVACGGAPASPTGGASAATSSAPAVSATMAATSASSVATAAPAAAGGNTLTYGLGFDVDDTLDPQVTNYDSTIRVTMNICEPLVWEPEPGKYQPALADSWDISPDAKTYTFHLKKGVKFTDGTDFNADAVKFTFDRVMDPATKAGQSHDQLGPYDHTEIVDPYTVKVVMKQGYAPLLSNLNGYLGIVSPSAVKKMGLADFARHPVGTGPFMFKEWVPKDHITLVKNPDYKWGSSMFKHTGPAYLDQIIFKVIPEDSVRTGTLKSGETQYIDQIDPLELQALKADPKFSVIQKGQPGSGWTLLLNQTSKGAMSDPQVRLAMEYAIDKEGVNKAVFQGLNQVAASALMKPTLGYDAATEKMYTYDPEKAKQILDQAGWKVGSDGIREKGGQKLAIDFPIISRPNDKAMAESIQASLRDVGIDFKVNPLERAAARDLIKQNKYDASFMWFSYGDPDVMRTLFASANADAFNRAKYKVPEVDKMLDDAAATTDTAKRTQLYAQIQERVLKDTAVVPLVDTIVYNAKRAEVQGDSIDALASYVWLYDVQIKK